MSRFNRAWTRTRIGRGLNREAEQRLKEIYRRGWEDGKRDDHRQWAGHAAKVKKGGVILMHEGRVHIGEFEVDNGSCREVAISALAWAIGELQRELAATIKRPGGTGKTGLDLPPDVHRALGLPDPWEEMESHEEDEMSNDLLSGWQPVSTAPKSGTVIIGKYGDDECDIFWSERPVCMLGTRCGSFPPGWATGGHDTDRNLPMDEPDAWKPDNA